MDKEKVEKLAKLARIELGSDEAESLSEDLVSVLGYVGDIKGAKVPEKEVLAEDFSLKSIMREDLDAHESGLYTEKILEQVPQRDGDYIRVKKIL